jgi:hypothetical protein
MSKRVAENKSQLFELDGHEALGSYLRIQPCSDNAPELSKCLIQWYRVSSEGGKKELISGICAVIFAALHFIDFCAVFMRINYHSDGPVVLFCKSNPTLCRDLCFFLLVFFLIAAKVHGLILDLLFRL